MSWCTHAVFICWSKIGEGLWFINCAWHWTLIKREVTGGWGGGDSWVYISIKYTSIYVLNKVLHRKQIFPFFFASNIFFSGSQYKIFVVNVFVGQWGCTLMKTYLHHWGADGDGMGRRGKIHIIFKSESLLSNDMLVFPLKIKMAQVLSKNVI